MIVWTSQPKSVYEIVQQEGAQVPIWAWYKRHGENKRPDLREMDFRGFNEPMTLMELEIPDEEVLLSNL